MLVSQSSPVIRAQAAQSSAKATGQEQQDRSEEDAAYRENRPTEEGAKLQHENGALDADGARSCDSEQHVDAHHETNHISSSQSNALASCDGSLHGRSSITTQHTVSPNFDESQDTTQAYNRQQSYVDSDADIQLPINRASASGHQKGNYQKKIDYISNVRNLSPRQHQILGYLTRGRDARFIEEKFCISHSTAKSHIYNIYGKLDVYSKQELIDLIERTQVPHYKDNPE